MMTEKIGYCEEQGGGPSGGELCKQLAGEVGRPLLRVRQRWTPTEANMGEGGAQEVEGHMSDSSTGPTLRTETDTFIWSRWKKVGSFVCDSAEQQIYFNTASGKTGAAENISQLAGYLILKEPGLFHNKCML